MRKLKHREGRQIVKVRHLVRGGPEHPESELSNHQRRLSTFVLSLGTLRCWSVRTSKDYRLLYPKNFLSFPAHVYQGFPEHLLNQKYACCVCGFLKNFLENLVCMKKNFSIGLTKTTVVHVSEMRTCIT